MRTLLILTVLFCSITSYGQKKASPFIKDRPMPAHAVNDFAKWLKKAQKDTLEKQIKAYRQRTGFDIVIITLPTLVDTKIGHTYSAQDVTNLYFDKWGMNDSLKNVRVLVLVEPNEIRIRTDENMGAYLTNNDCHRIFNEQMLPAFNASRYYTMFNDGIAEIENTIDNAVLAKKEQEAIAKDQAAAPQSQSAYSPYKPQQKEMTLGESIVGFLGLGAIVYFFVYRKRRRGVLMQSEDGGFDSDAVAWLTKEGVTARRTVNEH